MIYPHLIVFAIYELSSTVTLASTNTFLICKSCYYHIRDLRRIRRHLPLSTAKTISNSLITSRLDYCNSLINNIAKQDLSKFQRVQNCLARVVLRAPRFSPSLPLLKQLHWLPVNYRIKFKLSTLTYRALAIVYINHLIWPVKDFVQKTEKYTRTNIKAMSVSVIGAKLWNELDSDLRHIKNILLFKKN